MENNNLFEELDAIQDNKESFQQFKKKSVESLQVNDKTDFLSVALDNSFPKQDRIAAYRHAIAQVNNKIAKLNQIADQYQASLWNLLEEENKERKEKENEKEIEKLRQYVASRITKDDIFEIELD